MQSASSQESNWKATFQIIALVFALFLNVPVNALNLLRGMGVSITLSLQLLSLGFWFLFWVGVALWLSRKGERVRSLIRRIWMVLRNLKIILFGNLENNALLHDIYVATRALQESSLFARIVGLQHKQNRTYYILFSHQGNEPHFIGSGPRYRIPGFAVDEAEGIIRLWYLAANTLHLNWNYIQPLCGGVDCTWSNPDLQKRTLNGSLAIIGSPLKNRYAAELMSTLKDMEANNQIRRENQYLMEVVKREAGRADLCILTSSRNGDPQFIPTTPVGPSDTPLTDYALLMKLPNILGNTPSDEHSILFFAGCKAAGQVALTDWFSDPAKLGQIIAEFSSKSSSEFFYIIFKVKYDFVENGIPNVRETEIECKGEIQVDTRKGRPARAGR